MADLTIPKDPKPTKASEVDEALLRIVSRLGGPRVLHLTPHKWSEVRDSLNAEGHVGSISKWRLRWEKQVNPELDKSPLSNEETEFVRGLADTTSLTTLASLVYDKFKKFRPHGLLEKAIRAGAKPLKWPDEEQTKLVQVIKEHGDANWESIRDEYNKLISGKRTVPSMIRQYSFYLEEGYDRSKLSIEEADFIISRLSELRTLSNKWAILSEAIANKFGKIRSPLYLRANYDFKRTPKGEGGEAASAEKETSLPKQAPRAQISKLAEVTIASKPVPPKKKRKWDISADGKEPISQPKKPKTPTTLDVAPEPNLGASMPEAHYSLLVDALNAQIKQKDDELEELKRRVNELSAEVTRLTHANETLEVQVSRLGGPSTVFIASQSSEEDDGNNTDIFTL